MKIVRGVLLFTLMAVTVIAQAATLRDMQGNPHQLDEYAGNGKWLVVMFWASDCHVCNVEAEQYVEFHDAHKDSDAHILGVSLDGQARLEQAKQFMKRHEVSFPTLIGEPEQVAQMFMQLTGARWEGTPTFLIFNPEGKLVAQQVGAVPTDLIEEFIHKQRTVTPGEGDG